MLYDSSAYHIQVHINETLNYYQSLAFMGVYHSKPVTENKTPHHVIGFMKNSGTGISDGIFKFGF